MKITLKPIGIVKTQATEQETKTASDDLRSELEIYPKFEAALDGIDSYSHLFVLGYFHKLRPEQIGRLQVKPRRLMERGFSLEELPLLGVFALSSPTRPNPIGLSLVRLLKREGCKLLVEGLDFFDGTPIVDIKPYNRADSYMLPNWHEQLMS